MDGMKPPVGSVWESRDWRDAGRRVTVEKVTASYAWVRSVRLSRVRLPLTRYYRPVE